MYARKSIKLCRNSRSEFGIYIRYRIATKRKICANVKNLRKLNCFCLQLQDTNLKFIPFNFLFSCQAIYYIVFHSLSVIKQLA